MKKLLVAALGLLVASPVALAAVTERGGALGPALKTTICHRTKSAKNPYVRITVSTRAALNMHVRHPADIVPARGACPRTILTPTSGGVALTTALSGVLERPEAADPDGSGTATVRLRRGQGQACFSIGVERIALPAAGAHIHSGSADEAGPIAVQLRAPGAGGSSSGCVAVARSLVARILANRAGYYVHVHTTQFPGGAVRGQLGPMPGVHILAAALAGANERQRAGDPDGAGTATFRMREGSGEVCFTIAARDVILPAAGAHIHRGDANTSGPIVVPVKAPDASGGASGCTTVDAAIVTEILASPAGFYANVHTTDFPGGAIRGQLSEGG
jgi:hypothetical protein